MTLTADELTVAVVDDWIRFISDAKDERDPVRYLWDRALDMRLALTGG